jgi:hypothetical protein
MESWAQLTEPVEVPVVVAACRPQAAAPRRTSLPSKFPPDWPSIDSWVAPAASRRGLPSVSKRWARAAPENQRMNMAPNTAQP